MLNITEVQFVGLSDAEKVAFTKSEDGSYTMGAPEDVSGLKNTLDKFKGKNQTLEDQLKEVKAEMEKSRGGLSDTEFSGLLSLIQGEKQKDAVKLLSEGRTEEVIEILAGEQFRELKAKLESITGERDKLQGSNSDLIVNQAFDRLISGDAKFLGNKEGNETSRNDLLQIFKGSLIHTDDGMFIKDSSDGQKVKLNDKGEKVTPKAWYEDQKQARSNFFLGTQASDEHLGNGGQGGKSLDLTKIPTSGKIAAAKAAAGQK